LLEGCSKAKAEEAKGTRAQFRQGPQAQSLFFCPKMDFYSLQNKTNHMILRIEIAVE
jgi:hypothetical protein